MIGAIVGDIVGSRFEFRNCKSKEFTFLLGLNEQEQSSTHSWRGPVCQFTDDSVMTLAVAEAIRRWQDRGRTSMLDLSQMAVAMLQEFGREYPDAGYGGRFCAWIFEKEPKPYNSWGNGAAMRISACGWAAHSLEEVKDLSRAVTAITHNHPEGIKGAESTAVATFLARKGESKDAIRRVMVRDYYPLDFLIDDIRAGYKFDVSCQGSVPQAIEAFLESSDFEDAIRTAISIGGDSDTIGAICGSIAGAYYGVPDNIRVKALTFLPKQLVEVLDSCEHAFMVK